MKAILVNEDKSLRYDNVPDPVCGPEDCIVKIHAAALNRADLMQREGDYPPPPGCPEWMGLEIAGTMTQIDLKNIYMRNVRLIGSTLRSRTPEVKAQLLARLVEQVWPKVAAGQIRPTIFKVLPIEQAEAAQELLYKGQSAGKVVLTVS